MIHSLMALSAVRLNSSAAGRAEHAKALPFITPSPPANLALRPADPPGDTFIQEADIPVRTSDSPRPAILMLP